MRHLPALVAALLLPAAQPLLLGSALSTASLLVSQAPAQAQSAEAVGKVAQAITVRIEGATQGSGVLVKRDGNRYTVLTAWHVVSGQSKGEELDVYTADGQRHQLEQGSIKRLGEVDLAVLKFSSPTAYEVARVGDVKSVAMGSAILVAGFPLVSSSVPTRLLRLIKGDVIANATVAIPDGYQLLYDNQTLPGVSGGAVLNARGELVGIHGMAEKADQVSERSGKAIATGTNQGVPISYYKQYAAGEAVVASSSQAASADDYLAKVVPLLGLKDRENDVIRLSSQILSTRKSSLAYEYRAFAKSDLGDTQGAIEDLNQAVAINPQFADSRVMLCKLRSELGDHQGATSDCSEAIALEKQNVSAYYHRAKARLALGDKQGAFADYTTAASLARSSPTEIVMQALAFRELGDNQRALAALDTVIDSRSASNYEKGSALANRSSLLFHLGELFRACADLKRAVAMGNPFSVSYYRSSHSTWCRN